MVHGRMRSGKLSGFADDAGAFGKPARQVQRARERAKENRMNKLKKRVGMHVPCGEGRFWESVLKYRNEIGCLLLHAVGIGSFLRGMWLFVYQPDLTVFDLIENNS